MKYVDDITKLFTRFGANAQSYQEIQPNYKDFKDDPVTPVLAEPEPSVALPPLLGSAQAASLRSKGKDGKEWERVTDITYTIQSGPFKNVSAQWRNSTNRSTYADSANENRLIFRYTFKF